MPRYSDEQLDKKDTVDAIRTVVRLKYRIAQRRELNEVENSILEERERRLKLGLPFKLAPGELFND